VVLLLSGVTDEHHDESAGSVWWNRGNDWFYWFWALSVVPSDFTSLSEVRKKSVLSFPILALIPCVILLALLVVVSLVFGVEAHAASWAYLTVFSIVAILTTVLPSMIIAGLLIFRDLNDQIGKGSMGLKLLWSICFVGSLLLMFIACLEIVLGNEDPSDDALITMTILLHISTSPLWLICNLAWYHFLPAFLHKLRE
jgi:hypothetical protein